eukprot:CAMPEP_0204908054 /NCGR_PEP_ID=MMETSP1397-20131031/7058_1 /ASSEMBLY_ACC=CAM_ASM_000891 /TAXON_ID=49980 /ORGANISM="Climacostomum Climacostomum virens, Strain Stock W-24" /LENGTH=416 /DNA_ID=CAMNT_0052077413 /DNA_START=260 /DNA_END=1513 /DNA_ORIENTATION=+
MGDFSSRTRTKSLAIDYKSAANINIIQRQLLRVLTSLDETQSTLIAKTSAHIKQVTKIANIQVRALSALRLKVSNRVNNLTLALDDLKKKKITPDNEDLWSLIEESKSSDLQDISALLQMYKVEVNFEAVEDALNKAVVVEELQSKIELRDLPGRLSATGDINSDKLYYFTPYSNEMSILDFESGITSKKKFEAEVRFRNQASWCLLPRKQLMFTGGYESVESNEVLLIDIEQGTVRQLPGLITKRYAHSTLYFEGAVYVIGGISENVTLKSVERFDLGTQTWTTSADLCEPMRKIGITEKEGLFYLTGFGTKNIITYNPLDGSSAPIEFSFPEATFSAILFKSIDMHISILRGTHLYRLSEGGLEAVLDLPLGNWCSCSPPLIYNNKCYFLNWIGNKVWVYDFEGNAIRQIGASG